MLTKGTVLDGRYRIVRPLGRGGMGHVYQAFDAQLSKTVAIKETFANSDDMREAFVHEAKLLGNLKHASLPNVSSNFSEGERQFLVMEFIGGDTLLELLESRKLNSPHEPAIHYGEVINWAYTLLDVLRYLHERSDPIIHRDIKPTNIKLNDDGQIFLLDFGLAKGVAGQMTTIRNEHGLVSIYGYSEHYAPMEQISRSGTDPQTDLYALGATLYHLLTGSPPISAAKRFERVDRGLPDPLPPPHAVNPSVPPPLSRVVIHSMAMSRKDRVASAAAMSRELRQAEAAIRSYWVDMGPPEASLPPDASDSAAAEMFRLDSSATTAPLPPNINATTESAGADAGDALANGGGVRAIAQIAAVSQEATEQTAEASDQAATTTPDEQSAAPDDEPPVLDHVVAESQSSAEDELRAEGETTADGESSPEASGGEFHAGHDSEPPVSLSVDEQADKAEAGEAENDVAENDAAENDAEDEDPPALEDRNIHLWWTEQEENYRRTVLERARAKVDGEAKLQLQDNDVNVLGERGDLAGGVELLDAESPAGPVPETDDALDASASGRQARSSSDDGDMFSASASPRWRRWRTPALGAAALTVVGVVVAMVAYNNTSRVGENLNSTSNSNPVSEMPKPPAVAPARGQEALTLPVTHRVLAEQGGAVWSVAASPDGKLLASGGSDGRVRIWDAATAAHRQTLDAHPSDVYSVAFAPDSTTLASSGKDGEIKFWDLAKGTGVGALTGHVGEVYYVMFSPDGSKLASAGRDKTIKLWDVRDRKVLAAPSHDDKVWAVVFSPDGQTVAAAGEDKLVRRWDASSGAEIMPRFAGHTAAILAIAFSHDGRFLASGSKDGVVKVWEAATATEKVSRKIQKEYVTSLAFSPDDKVLASGGWDRVIQLWDTARWSPKRKLTENKGRLTSLVFSADGVALMSGSEDGAVRLWKWD